MNIEMDTRIEKELNSIIEEGSEAPGIYDLINYYYYNYIGHLIEYPDGGSESAGDRPEPQELYEKMDSRASGIGDAIVKLLDAGFGIDAADGGFNALMLAVGTGDHNMVRFLIEHGSDPNVWPEKDKDLFSDNANFYLDDIDLHFSDEIIAMDRDDRYIEGLKKTAEVLVNIGGLRDYSGFCLAVTKDGEISFAWPKMKY